MQVILSRIRRRLADESGMTMAVVMGVLLVATLFSVAAIASADRDISQSRSDIDRKAAYSAAEAGLNDYMARLNQDSNYWTNCDQVPAPAPVNQRFVRTSPTQADPRKWRMVPGSTEADYTIELIPANGATACDPNNPAGTMIDSSTGTFTIRSTGRSRAAGTGTPVYRSIVAKFRRRGFLDFLYFTDLETTDPEFFRGTSTYQQALTTCIKYKRNGRTSPPCSEITFVQGDVVNGPLHTNDRLLISGSPIFGRTSADPIEVVAAPPAGPSWEPNGTGSPTFRGTFMPGAASMDLPPTNAQLNQIAGWTFTGDTELQFNNTTVTVKNQSLPGGQATMSTSDPSFNGVIYVNNGTCSNPGTRQNPYPSPRDYGCANVWVSGVYSKSMTIASAGDVIVKASDDIGSGPNGQGLRRNGDVIAGLIANNFIRVYHPCTNGSNQTGTVQNVQIDAAILSLAHSFTVDNYDCGAKLGTLTVNGAIAQKFRGPVGTFGGTLGTGYIKNYTYDDRLLYRAPPFFLDPVQSAWRTVSYTEQTPASK
jgi:Tfp pilus assembly protein PilX